MMTPGTIPYLIYNLLLWPLLASILISLCGALAFKKDEKLYKSFECFLFLLTMGFTAVLIGYMSSYSRQTGMPDIAAAIITGFLGFVIYEYSNKEPIRININVFCVSIIYFMFFLYYGAAEGANQRDLYENATIPEKKAIQESMLKKARIKYGVTEEPNRSKS